MDVKILPFSLILLLSCKYFELLIVFFLVNKIISAVELIKRQNVKKKILNLGKLDFCVRLRTKGFRKVREKQCQ